MIDVLVNALSGIPPELASLLLASVPVAESRVAIPVALFVFDLAATPTFIYTFIGNSLPVFILFWILPACLEFLRRHVRWIDRWLVSWFENMRTRYGESYSKWGAFFLFFFVVIPGIGTGAWGASLLGVLLKIDARLAVPSIIAGVFISGLAVLGVSLGVFSGIQLL
ncbi:MAG: small multi-drug export protein [Patescibacteria group bacterium]